MVEGANLVEEPLQGVGVASVDSSADRRLRKGLEGAVDGLLVAGDDDDRRSLTSGNLRGRQTEPRSPSDQYDACTGEIAGRVILYGVRLLPFNESLYCPPSSPIAVMWSLRCLTVSRAP